MQHSGCKLPVNINKTRQCPLDADWLEQVCVVRFAPLGLFAVYKPMDVYEHQNCRL